MRGRRMIAGERRALRHVLFQAALAAACHNPAVKPVARRLKEKGKPHKLVIIAIARRLITIANAVLKSGTAWQHQTRLNVVASNCISQVVVAVTDVPLLYMQINEAEEIGNIDAIAVSLADGDRSGKLPRRVIDEIGKDVVEPVRRIDRHVQRVAT